MGSKYTEVKIRHTVACPRCGAVPGQGCRYSPSMRAIAEQTGRIMVHPERRQAWQVWKRTHPDVREEQ